MPSNIVIQDFKKEHIFRLKNNQHLNVFLFNTNNANSDIKLKIYLLNKNIVNVYALDLNNHHTKKYMCEIYHNGNCSTSQITFLCLAKNNAKTNIDCLTYNKQKKVGNKLAQDIKGFIFDNESSILALPSLDINDNNVVANHTVSIGQIDPNIIFYLETKGFTKKKIYSFLINSFTLKILHIFNNKQKSIIKAINSFLGK